MMRRWQGRWLLAVAALHTLVGVVEFHPVLAELLHAGVIDSIGRDPLRGAVSWFLLFGWVLALVGLGLDRLEQQGLSGGVWLGWGLLGLVALGGALMPVSGFWLALPPAIALVRSR